MVADEGDLDRLQLFAEALGLRAGASGGRVSFIGQDGAPIPEHLARAHQGLLSAVTGLREGTRTAAEEARRRRSELRTRRGEVDLLCRLSRQSARQDCDGPVYERMIEEIAATFENAYLIVSLMIRDFTYAKGCVGLLSGDRLLAAPIPWEEVSSRILQACLENPDPCAYLPPEALGELEEVCGRDLEAWCIPIRIEGRTVGFAALARPHLPSGQPQPRLKLLEGLAHHIARTLGSVQLRSELQSFLFSTAKSLVAAVDAKDPYTRGHSERVHYLAVCTGQQMGLDAGQLSTLSWAALLHDIGKISIPESILRKSGMLTDEEWAIIRTHPERGCQVIRPIPQLTSALPAIRHHHERYGGGGYPDGLVATEIPLLARIIAVADAFDAITSSRPYTQAQSCEDGLKILARTAGARYDPEVVAAVRQVVEREVSAGSFAFEPQRRLEDDQLNAA
jgi:HD-GYP domain-containing protein (c-di-GMP phosphodiesterase class II)